MASLPLSGIRVLDLSRVLAGPWATQMLADLGATVIKIEKPGSGDDTRGWGPPWAKDASGKDTAESAYFLCANRGKQSITVDITTPEGQAHAQQLARECDVLVENYKVGGLAKYGLDYANIRKLNPRLVYCSITGFGQTGPYKDRAGYDFMIQGLGGLMSITGEKDGEPGGGPQKVGVAVVDLFTGMYSSVAILAALRHRDATGEGQHIDMALLDCSVAMLANVASNYLVSGKVPQRMGNAHPNIVPYQAFRCRDGFLILAVGNDEQFARFCAEAGLQDVAADARFVRNQGRVQHRDALVPVIEEVFLTRDRDDWLAAFERLGIPAGPINTIDQVFADPQVIARGLRIDLPHPTAGTVPGVANPIRFSATPLVPERAPPVLGQDGVV
ncbi:MAG: CaiB/BaiF CoA-transferase family protein [Burkholderiales bacterium]|nr:CaiB/BaiF CoA-transferase family protein [Burkholderiales bacterium]